MSTAFRRTQRGHGETDRKPTWFGTKSDNDADNVVGYRKRLKACKTSIRGPFLAGVFAFCHANFTAAASCSWRALQKGA